MDYEGYRVLSMVSLVLCGLSFLFTIILFINFRIPKIFGEITGITARKAIKEIGYAQINVKYKKQISSRLLKGKQLGKISNSDRLARSTSGSIGKDNKTELLKHQGNKVSDDYKTELLRPSYHHKEDDVTEVLNPKCYQTVNHSDHRLEKLSEDQSTISQEDNQVFIVEDITFIHTEENIKG